MTTSIIYGYRQAPAAIGVSILFVFIPLLATASTSECARLKQPILLKLTDRQVSLAAGTQVQILKEGAVTTVISFELKGNSIITQIPSSQLDRLPIAAPGTGTSTGAAPVVYSKALPDPAPPVNDIPISDTPPTPLTLPDQEDGDEVLPDFRTTLSAADIQTPAARFTALNGSFYVVIDGAPILVVYSLPMDGNQLAPSASNLIFYGPYPDEKTNLTGNIVPDIVTKLGSSVFSFSFKADGQDLNQPQTAYWSKESGWFQAVMDARAEIVKGFGLKKQKLLLMGYSGGGGMVLNLAGTFPDDVEAVAAQGANLVPELTGPNPIKWLVINNRGEPNAAATKPFYDKLKTMGCQALYCETTPSRARGSYHAPSQEAFNLIYSFLAGMLEQRKRTDSGQTSLTDQWPYAAPIAPLKRYHIVRSETLDSDSLGSGNFDLLPSATFALNWSNVCPPIQSVRLADEEGTLHVNFPASSKPNGLVIYYDAPDYQEFPREFEDICALAESGSVVISPRYKMPPEKFAQISSDWVASQATLQRLPVHLAAYGESGARFLSAMSDVTKLSFKSVNLVGPTDFSLEPTIAENIESLAKGCGLYSFFICRNRPSYLSTGLSGLAHTLVDNQSRTRGCQELVINADIDDEDVRKNIYQQALSTIVQTVTDYNGNPTITSPDLWLDSSYVSDQPDVPQPDASKPDVVKPYVVNQPVYVTVDVHDRGIYGKQSTIELKAAGTLLAKHDLSLDYDGDQKITLSYVPTESGEVDAEVVLLSIPEEASKDNNSAEVKFVVGKGP